MFVLGVEEGAVHTEGAEGVLADGDGEGNGAVGVGRFVPVEEAYSEADEDG